MISQCICKSDFMDKTYGKGNRVHNLCKYPPKSGDFDKGIRCIVCGREKPKPEKK